MARRFCLMGLFVSALVVLGCSDSKEDQSVQVTGTVNVDGKPLPEGSISFVGDPGSVPASLTISNGSFEGKVAPGKKKVEIMAYKTVKAPPTATEPGDVKENYIPAEFNTKSKLTAEVTENGLNPSTFDVKSK